MDICKCGHQKWRHELLRQTMFPYDKEPPVIFRGKCRACNCALYEDRRQMSLMEQFGGEITIS
jgi:hypothetical protein